jgi:hypothetical protein
MEAILIRISISNANKNKVRAGKSIELMHFSMHLPKNNLQKE